MNPISWFVVISTGATGALLFAMGSRSMGLIMCAVAIGLHRWFRRVRLQAKDRPAVGVDERHDDADPKAAGNASALPGHRQQPRVQIGT